MTRPRCAALAALSTITSIASISAITAIIAITVLAAPTPAQGGQRTFESAEHGFRLTVPKFLAEQPLDPMEEQILAKFMGRQKAKWNGDTRELELMLLVVRIRKQAAPKTGGAPTGSAQAKDKDDKDKDVELESLQDHERRQLNGGKTIEEFLARHSYVNTKRLQNQLTEPVRSREGRDFDITEVSSNRDANIAVRAFTLEDEREIFGLLALGVGAVEAFHPQVLASAKSLERIAAPAEATSATEADPYAGSPLRGLDKRRQVRRDLVAGWTAQDTDNFILVTNVAAVKLVDDMLVDLEIMRRAYVAQFPPIASIEAVSTVRVCASYDDYRRFGAPAGTGGYWNPLSEELVLFDPGKRPPKANAWLEHVDPKAVLYHEAMHQYLYYANGQVSPASWFDEGFGEVFGGAKVDRRKGEIAKLDKNAFRLPRVQELQKKGAWPDLANVLRMSKGDFYSPGSVLQNYAMGWALCYFLVDEGRKTKDRREDWAAIPGKYLASLRAAADARRSKMPPNAPRDWLLALSDEMQAEAFEKTFGGVDLVELEKAWIAFMKKL